jgi:hypothetical protein
VTVHPSLVVRWEGPSEGQGAQPGEEAVRLPKEEPDMDQGEGRMGPKGGLDGTWTTDGRWTHCLAGTIWRLQNPPSSALHPGDFRSTEQFGGHTMMVGPEPAMRAEMPYFGLPERARKYGLDHPRPRPLAANGAEILIYRASASI